ncbi:hypothetical protein [Falsiroseomonas bella]|uniref:hypothetical protein n=1 Tax=Falsiroseomonas bella TaxID=2184016 RepID=UPI0011B5DBF8|nr:hypothetical protein [Falsiroseomonas bella]
MQPPRNRKGYPIPATLPALLLAAWPALAQPAPPPAEPPRTEQPAPPTPGGAEDCGCGVPANPRGPR